MAQIFINSLDAINGIQSSNNNIIISRSLNADVTATVFVQDCARDDEKSVAWQGGAGVLSETHDVVCMNGGAKCLRISGVMQCMTP